MANYRALVHSAPLAFPTRILTCIAWGSAASFLGLLPTGTSHRRSALAGGTGPIVAQTATCMLPAVQRLPTHVGAGSMWVWLITTVAVTRLATGACLLDLNCTGRTGTRVTRRWTGVRAGVPSFGAAQIPAAMRNGSGVILWISHLSAEAVVGLRLLTGVLTEGAPKRPPLPTLLRLSPLLDAVQVKDTVALLAGPDSGLVLDDIQATGAVVLPTDQLLAHGLG